MCVCVCVNSYHNLQIPSWLKDSENTSYPAMLNIAELAPPPESVRDVNPVKEFIFLLHDLVSVLIIQKKQ